MAGALRRAGEAAAKQRRLGAAVSERSEFCRSAAAPLGLLVLFDPRKEQAERYGSMFRIDAP